MHKDSVNKQMDSSKYVRYTPEQVEALERVYTECPKPSSLRRQQLIRECPILSNIEPKQIKVWFQNRRYRGIWMFVQDENFLLSCYLITNLDFNKKMKGLFFFFSFSGLHFIFLVCLGKMGNAKWVFFFHVMSKVRCGIGLANRGGVSIEFMFVFF